MADEINLAEDSFVDELIGSALAFPHSFIYLNSNGAHPDLHVYTQHLNSCRPLDIFVEELLDSDILKKTYDQLIRAPKKDNWRYYHFNFKDNPILDEERITSIKSGYVPGSYLWLTKVEGGRGAREGAIYADFMTYNKNILPHREALKQKYQIFTLGFDTGYRDYNVITLNGFTRGYDKHIVLDMVKLNKANIDQMWTAIEAWITPYLSLISNRVHGVFIDYASGGRVIESSLRDRFMNIGIKIGEMKKLRIKERVEIGIDLLQAGRLQFSDKCIEVYEAFTAPTYTKDRTKTDIREWGNHIHKDIVDSVEYGQQPFVKYMLRNR